MWNIGEKGERGGGASSCPLLFHLALSLPTTAFPPSCAIHATLIPL